MKLYQTFLLKQFVKKCFERFVVAVKLTGNIFAQLLFTIAPGILPSLLQECQQIQDIFHNT